MELNHHERDRIDDWHTIARWKSGLLPLTVLARSVNWETQSTSPAMSFTLWRHITPSTSSKTRSDKLQVSIHDKSMLNLWGRWTHIFLAMYSESSCLSSTLVEVQLRSLFLYHNLHIFCLPVPMPSNTTSPFEIEDTTSPSTAQVMWQGFLEQRGFPHLRQMLKRLVVEQLA